MKRFAYRIKREVSYVEDVEAIIVAASEKEAERIAAGIGDGESPYWPSIERFNVANQEPQRHELLDLEYVPMEPKRA